jgi:hypothetical protein
MKGLDILGKRKKYNSVEDKKMSAQKNTESGESKFKYILLRKIKKKNTSELSLPFLEKTLSKLISSIMAIKKKMEAKTQKDILPISLSKSSAKQAKQKFNSPKASITSSQYSPK